MKYLILVLFLFTTPLMSQDNLDDLKKELQEYDKQIKELETKREAIIKKIAKLSPNRIKPTVTDDVEILQKAIELNKEDLDSIRDQTKGDKVATYEPMAEAKAAYKDYLPTYKLQIRAIKDKRNLRIIKINDSGQTNAKKAVSKRSVELSYTKSKKTYDDIKKKLDKKASKKTYDAIWKIAEKVWKKKLSAKKDEIKKYEAEIKAIYKTQKEA